MPTTTTRAAGTLFLFLFFSLATAGFAQSDAALDVIDLTSGDGSHGAPEFPLRSSHELLIEIRGDPTERIVLLGSLTRATDDAFHDDVPLLVDLERAHVLADGYADRTSRIFGIGAPLQLKAVVPSSIPLGTAIYLQAFLVDIDALVVRATNGIKLISHAEPASSIASGHESAHPLARAGGALVVRDRAAWEELWTLHGASDPLPDVDFPRMAVAAVFAGERPTSGYSIEVASVRIHADKLLLDVVETRPSPDCPTEPRSTQPFEFLIVPRYTAVLLPLPRVTVAEEPCTR